MHFSPAASGLTASTVQVEGLEPYANYTFTIKSQSRVSGLDSSSPSSASLSINMGQAGEAPQTTGMGDGQEAAEVQLKSFLLPHSTLSFRVSRVTLWPVTEAGEERAEAAGADLGRVPTPKPWGESEL